MTPGAVIVCGGRSRRMGRPKEWLPFGEELMLQRVVRLAGMVAERLAVVSAPGQTLPELPDTVIQVHDPVEGRGPLQGLRVGLAALPEQVDVAYATSSDVPFLQPAWVERLLALLDDHDLAIPYVDGFYHPLAAIYRRKSVLPAIDRLLAADRLRLTLLSDEVHSRVVTADELRDVDPEFRTLRNLNSPADYQSALTDAGYELTTARVRFQIVGALRLQTGMNEGVVEAATVADALCQLAKLAPAVAGVLIAKQNLQASYTLYLNGKQLITDETTLLLNGDTLTLQIPDAPG